MSINSADDQVAPEPATVSGKAVVVGMFVFGVMTTSLIWFYWNKHIEPFMPLQMALAGEFDNSSPRVEGGQRKIHKTTPKLLRVTMRSPYDPTAEEFNERIEVDLRKIADIASDYLDLSSFDLLEVHFYKPNPEKLLLRKEFLRSLPNLEPVDAGVSE
jgi:hypothetical protein